MNMDTDKNIWNTKQIQMKMVSLCYSITYYYISLFSNLNLKFLIYSPILDASKATHFSSLFDPIYGSAVFIRSYGMNRICCNREILLYSDVLILIIHFTGAINFYCQYQLFLMLIQQICSCIHLLSSFHSDMPLLIPLRLQTKGPIHEL